MSATTLVNGRYTDSVCVMNRGLAYGDGLFETIRIANGKACYLTEHLLRLDKGCKRLRINCDITTVAAEVKRLLTQNTGHTASAVLKITITREATARSYQTHRTASAERILSLTQWSPLAYQRLQKQGVAVMVCNTRLSINPQLAGIKHLCRLENVLARAEWHTDAIAEGLLLDTQGRLIEGTMSNVFLVKKGRVYTPALHRCGVEGIIRQHIISKGASELGLEVIVSDLTLTDLYQSEELFLCNSLIGIWPVTAVACHKKRTGNITRCLQRFINSQP